jgi:hypothetical protein
MPDFTPTDFEATRREPGFIGLDQNGPIFAALEEVPAARLAAASEGPLWWPRADNRIQRAPEDGGSILDGYGERGLWHTTETDGWPGYGSGYFPHLTVKINGAGRFQAHQHIPFTRASRALRNEPGGVQTNRVTRCQVEIVTRADVVDTYGLHPAMVDGLADLAEWLRANWGVPKACSVTFKPYPASYGKGNGVRLSPSAWERYAGWLGHMHAPENDHGDPGALDWRPILQREADMPLNDADKQWIEQRLDAHTADLGRKVEDLYRLAARGELGGAIDPSSTHYADSVRGTREAILDALGVQPEPPA